MFKYIVHFHHVCLFFRFYSSTNYFSLPPQSTGEWYELSIASCETLEDCLGERLDSIVTAVLRTKTGQCLKGLKSPASTLYKVMEEVSALYSWDRPAIHSPVKKGKKAEHKFGNSVVVVTKLPEDTAELERFLGSETRKKPPTLREIVDSFISKRVMNEFSGELNISVHILDTGEHIGWKNGEVVQLFNAALKEVRGGVMLLSTLSTPLDMKVDRDSQYSILVCASRAVQRVPSSAVVQGHLAEVVIPSNLLDKSYGQEKILIGEEVMGLEFKNCGVKLSEFESRGFIGSTFFKVGQHWKESLSVWSDKTPAFGPILSYLQHAGQCLLLENKVNIMAVMFFQTKTSATFCIMDKVESHFYHLLLSLDSHIPTITLNKEVETLMKDIKSLQCSPSKKPAPSPKIVTTQFDVSVFENWRLPDIPAPNFLTSLKTATASLTGLNSSYHKLMTGVRESYTGRKLMKGEKIKVDIQSKVILDNSEVGVANKLEKQLLTVSIGCNVSVGNDGAKEKIKSKEDKLNQSRVEVFRQSGEDNRNSDTHAGDGKEHNDDGDTFVQETKTRAVADLIKKMGDHGQESAAMKNSLLTGTDDLLVADSLTRVNKSLMEIDKKGNPKINAKNNSIDDENQVVEEFKPSSVSSTPYITNPERAKKLSLDKLKMEINELNMVMDKAVEEKNFLKAHETQQFIQKLEVLIKKIDAGFSSVKHSLSDVSGVETTPKVTLKVTLKSTKNVSVFSTPGSLTVTPSVFKKYTPGQLSKQEEIEKKTETLEKEKQARKEAPEKDKLIKEEAMDTEEQSKKDALVIEKAEKDRQKEVVKRAIEVERLEKEKVRKAVKEIQVAEKQEKEVEMLKKKDGKVTELDLKEEEKLAKDEEQTRQNQAEKEKVGKNTVAFNSFLKKDEVVKEIKISCKEVEKVGEGYLGNFTQFRVKDNMRLAPTVRGDSLKAKKIIDGLDMPSGPDGLYLALLKSDHTPGHQTRTWPYDRNVPKKSDDKEILQDKEEKKSDPEHVTDQGDGRMIINGAYIKLPRPKLLQFHENKRPAFWGTWTKNSQLVSGRYGSMNILLSHLSL